MASLFEYQFIETSDICEEFDDNEHFVCQAQDCQVKSFRVNRDLYEGYFVAICPSKEDKKHLVWISRALSYPNSNQEHLGCLLIHYSYTMLQSYISRHSCFNGLYIPYFVIQSFF